MKKVFISYDYDGDKNYKNTLLMWSNNNRKYFRNFTFKDGSTDISINSTDRSAIKRAISRRMAQCDVFLLLVGKETYKSAWCDWESLPNSSYNMFRSSIQANFQLIRTTGKDLNRISNRLFKMRSFLEGCEA